MKNLYYLFILSFLLISCEEEVPPITYTLTTKVTPPGAGTVDPASGSYDEGSSVTISATPTENYSFKQWTGTGSGTANPLIFKIISNTTITAEFELIDSDNDGVADALDKCSNTPTGVTVNSEGCALSQLDSDSDGVADDKDQCPNTTEGESVDENGCSTPFYLDENGVTVKAKDWVTAGTTGELNGIFYTAVNIDTLRLMFSREEDVSKVVTTLITDMSYLFSNAPVTPCDCPFGGPDEILFNPDISSWDVSNITNMSYMFGSKEMIVFFNKDISKWDVSKVTDMSNMFNSAKVFNQNIGSWDVSNVTDMSGIFRGAETFNQDIGSWDVSKVTDMSWMFYISAFNKDISKWNVSNVTNMSSMFVGSFNNNSISGWNVSKVTDMSNMFSGNF